MNREQLAEKVARASHQHGLDVGLEYCPWGDLPASVQRQYLGDARAVLDAILPQIETVEELDALPVATVLVSEKGFPAVVDGDRVMNPRLAAKMLPFTVVWTPPEH